MNEANLAMEMVSAKLQEDSNARKKLLLAVIGKASVAAYMHPVQLQGDDHTQGCQNNNKEKKRKER